MCEKGNDLEAGGRTATGGVKSNMDRLWTPVSQPTCAQVKPDNKKGLEDWSFFIILGFKASANVPFREELTVAQHLCQVNSSSVKGTEMREGKVHDRPRQY